MSKPSKKENKKENKVYYKLDQLRIKLVLDDVKVEVGNNKTQNDPNPFLFKPKMVDSSLNDIIYFTPKFELTPENLLDAGFNNNTKTHREVLTNEDKMRKFISYMNDREKRREKEEEKRNEEEEKIKKEEEKRNEEENERKLDDIFNKNTKFINTVFLKKNEILKLSDKKQFVIYKSYIDEKITKASKPSKGGKYVCTIKIQLLDKSSKLTNLDKAKISCMERAKRIEENADDLFDISLELYKTTNMYNPIEVYKQIRNQTSRNRSIKKIDKKTFFNKQIQKIFKRDLNPETIYNDKKDNINNKFRYPLTFPRKYADLKQVVLDKYSSDDYQDEEDDFLEQRIEEKERNGTTSYIDLVTGLRMDDKDQLKKLLRGFDEDIENFKKNMEDEAKAKAEAEAAKENGLTPAESVGDPTKHVHDGGATTKNKNNKQDIGIGWKRKKRYTRRRGKSRKSRKKTKKFKNRYRKL